MRRISIMVLILILYVGLAGCQKKAAEEFSLESGGYENTEENVKEKSENTGSIFVYVCGAVNCEGVYELPRGSRVCQAIEAAGGFREDANATNVNQAVILEDEDCIYVPAIGEEVQMDYSQDGKININKASKEDLMSLPGIGQSRAESIIKHREDIGAFQNIEDIMQVSGIKEGLFEKIKDLITI